MRAGELAPAGKRRTLPHTAGMTPPPRAARIETSMPSRETGPVIMAEVNERLARVETRLDGQGEVLSRLERHTESMSASHSEMAKAVSQIPGLFSQMLEVQRSTANQEVRLTTLENEMERSKEARKHLAEVIEPKIHRSHMISSATAWTAALLITAVITATAKGWLE